MEKVSKTTIIEKKHASNAKPKRNRRRRGKRSENANNESITATPSGFGKERFVPIPTIMAKTAKFRRETKPKVGALSDAAAKWVLAYLDPCGKHDSRPGAVMIPDGAPQQLACLNYSTAQTIKPPYIGSGLNLNAEHSMCFVSPPSVRSHTYVMARVNGGEFGKEQVKLMMEALSGITDIKTVTYPNWLATEPDSNGKIDMYVTSLAPTLMADIRRPTADSVGEFTSFREAARGMTIMFNAPDLANQGTVTVGQWRMDSTIKTVVPESAGFPVVISITLIGGSPARVNIAPTAHLEHANIKWAHNSNSATFESSSIIEAANGAIAVGIGEQYRYEVRQAPNGLQLSLTNITTTTSVPMMLRLATIPVGIIHAKTVLMGVVDEVKVKVVNSKYRAITMPALSQADITQLDPNHYVGLLRENGGVYVPSRAWQPVFPFQDASGLAKWGFVTSLEDDTMPVLTGYSDSFDAVHNFTVVNCQGMSYGATPFVKTEVRREVVPTMASQLGATLIKAGAIDTCAMDLAHELANAFPHGFPASANGIGWLFAKVSRVLKLLPDYQATAKRVASIVDDVVAECGNITELVEKTMR